MLLKIRVQDFPGGLSGSGESACQHRRHGFDPWFGEIPHAAGQLSLCTPTTEPKCLQAMLHRRSHRSEKCELLLFGAPARPN